MYVSKRLECEDIGGLKNVDPPDYVCVFYGMFVSAHAPVPLRSSAEGRKSAQVRAAVGHGQDKDRFCVCVPVCRYFVHASPSRNYTSSTRAFISACE